MVLSTRTTELFNEMLFAGSVIVGIVANDPSYIQQKGKWLSNICPLLSESPVNSFASVPGSFSFLYI